MLTPYEEERYDESTGETSEINIPNLRRIRSIGYIKEAIAWNPDINTDRCSAMDMVMILREDRKKMTNAFDSNSKEETNLFDGDEFLDENWTKAMNKGYNGEY
jgi:hypothetical protein